MTGDPPDGAGGPTRRVEPLPGGDHVLTRADGEPAAGVPQAVKHEGVVHVARQRLRVSLVSPGTGRPLLLINGIGATGDLFDDFRVHLTDRETIAFDAPGVGGSPAPWYPWRISWFAKVVSGMIRELGHRQVDVLGISWGGALAQELAIRHPENVRRLVLVATTPGVISLPGTPQAVAILMTPLRYWSSSYLERVAPTLYGGEIRRNPQLLRRHARVRATRPPSTRGYATQMMAMRYWSALPGLSRTTTRTLVLTGDDDPIIPVLNGRLINGAMPNAQLQVVEGGGHMFLFTRAAEMADRVRSFLDQA